MSNTTGLALRCDPQGNIVEVLQNPPALGLAIEIGMPFTRLAAPGSLAKALSFVRELNTNQAAYDWELDIQVGESVKTCYFTGGKTGDSLLVVGSLDAILARTLFEETILVDNEQTKQLHYAFKQMAADTQLYEEITRLNNELVSIQRELAKKNAQLERLYAQEQISARKDSLTGTLNRGGFFEIGEEEVLRAIRLDHPYSVLLFDLDHFKTVNDTYGHETGDHVLKEIATRCTNVLRRVDILGRYGGEEFAVLLPNRNLEGARLVAERLGAAARQPIQTEHGPLTITISLGIAVRDAATTNLDDLLRRADQALYHAKESGRDQFSVSA